MCVGQGKLIELTDGCIRIAKEHDDILCDLALAVLVALNRKETGLKLSEEHIAALNEAVNEYHDDSIRIKFKELCGTNQVNETKQAGEIGYKRGLDDDELVEYLVLNFGQMKIGNHMGCYDC
jgi:hypothetical protein